MAGNSHSSPQALFSETVQMKRFSAPPSRRLGAQRWASIWLCQLPVRDSHFSCAHCPSQRRELLPRECPQPPGGQLPARPAPHSSVPANPGDGRRGDWGRSFPKGPTYVSAVPERPVRSAQTLRVARGQRGCGCQFRTEQFPPRSREAGLRACAAGQRVPHRDSADRSREIARARAWDLPPWSRLALSPAIDGRGGGLTRCQHPEGWLRPAPHSPAAAGWVHSDPTWGRGWPRTRHSTGAPGTLTARGLLLPSSRGAGTEVFRDMDGVRARLQGGDERAGPPADAPSQRL